MFYDNFTYLCKQSDLKPYTVLRMVGIGSKSILGQWRKGSVPRADTLEKIARFFAVAPRQLAYGDVRDDAQVYDGLTHEERAVVMAFRAADPATRSAMLTILQSKEAAELHRDGGEEDK